MRVPSMYHLMSHLDLDDGVRYPLGGFTELIDRVAALAEASGARLVTGARVTGITRRSRTYHHWGVASFTPAAGVR